MDNVATGRLAKNLGVGGLLLAGIFVCVAQGYSGYLAQQAEAVAPLPEPISTIEDPRQVNDRRLANKNAGIAAPPADMSVVKMSARPSQEHGLQGLARPAVWQPQKAVRQLYNRAPPHYRPSSPALGPSGRSPTFPANWQRPAVPISRPAAHRGPTRSGRVPSIAPGFEGKACGMGLG